MKLPIIPFDQPAGTFYLSAMSATELIRIAKADPLKYDAISMETSGGIQREPSRPRVREIAEYADTIDAAFPTAVLLALNNSNYTMKSDAGGKMVEIVIEGDQVADIVDGQHRVLGLMQSHNYEVFEIPVVFMLDATEEQKALIFATINGKQAKVLSSLIYQLFDVTTTRSPQKSAHEIARAMNSSENSPWYRRLKMLGKKTPGTIESLSQGTFVKFLLPLISDEPYKDRDLIIRKEPLVAREKCIFNDYLRNNEDATILKIMMNTFQGARSVWPDEWNNPNQHVLTKTTGFTGIMKALPEMFRKGQSKQDLSADFFTSVFKNVKTIMQKKQIPLTTEYFLTSAAGESQFRDLILEG